MALPASGEISINDINVEFGRSGTTANSSLEDLSDGTVATINTANASADRPDGSAPHAMTEFYSYDHDLATTSWSNVPADFNLHTLASNFNIDSATSGAKSITLTGGSGTTSITCQQPSNGNIELKLAFSLNGDPGTSGTANSGSGFQNNAPVISTTSNDTIYLRFKLIEVKANSGNLSAEDRTITFTNNGVSNTDLQINCQIDAGGGGGLPQP
jgi:hypothetical protein